jgi:hypothetical protein
MSGLRTEAEIIADYHKQFAWRDLWQRLSNRKPKKSWRSMLQSREDRIQRRAVIANNKIRDLMREIDEIHARPKPDGTK